MKRLAHLACFSIVLAAADASIADAVRLKNGDVVQGRVVSLTGEMLTLSSDNFGELQIPRDRIELIGLGEEAAAAVQPTQQGLPAGSGAPTAGQLPSMRDPAMQQQVNQMLGRIFGGQDMSDLSRHAGQAGDSLRDLSRDMEGPEAEAIKNYTRLFDLIAPPEPQAENPPPTDGGRAPGSGNN